MNSKYKEGDTVVVKESYLTNQYYTFSNGSHERAQFVGRPKYKYQG